MHLLSNICDLISPWLTVYIPIFCLILSLLYTCIVGDYLLYNVENSLVKAVSDNITHGLVGFLSWFIIIYNVQGSFLSNIKSNWKGLLASGLISCIIDIDHFILAHSLHLKVILIFSMWQLTTFFSGCSRTTSQTLSSLFCSSCHLSHLFPCSWCCF